MSERMMVQVLAVPQFQEHAVGVFKVTPQERVSERRRRRDRGGGAHQSSRAVEACRRKA